MITIYDVEVKDINLETINMDSYRGKTLLIVNVASACGFTPQYKGLQELYDKYKDQGFEILAFPCNQFGGQEPASNAEIQAFARDRFDANFPMFAKVDVNGDNSAPIYTWLKESIPGDIGWNFTKYLVNSAGQVIKRFDPQESPEAIGAALGDLL